ncbi:MAG: glycosyl hydrolase family 65 protein, partial [Mucilaginibacter sp.]|uniref:glycosyl hydrolase family 65 protein n=1 Tax=Mucilaginibacter sp. TaxID=1882438 RepID=UPI0032656682
IGEYQDEKNGKWLKGDNPRSTFYNHSSYADLIINDLVGIKPRADQVLEIYPLIPQGQWNWFMLDKVSYHGRNITIVWDKTGTKYGAGKGMLVYADGKKLAQSQTLKHILVNLPAQK